MTTPTQPSDAHPNTSDSNPTPATLDAQAFRSALSLFATGITVITATGPDGRRVGVTANSFNSVSLSPPLVLWSLAHKSGSLQAFVDCSHFAVNVLSSEQEALARHFAQHSADKFAGIEVTQGLGGCLLLPGALAHFQCRSRSRYPEGDHSIFVGEVMQFDATPAASPLVYQARQYWHGLKT